MSHNSRLEKCRWRFLKEWSIDVETELYDEKFFLCMSLSSRRAFRLRHDARVMKISSERSSYVEETCDLRQSMNTIKIFVMF
jgi:hypothetical protein